MPQYEEYYIEKEGEYYREISTDSFLAGILLCKNTINYLSEYWKLIEAFENNYQVSVVGQENLVVNIVVQDTTIRLVDDYDKIICVNGEYIDVRSYLYSLASDEVKEFFGLKEPKRKSLKKYLDYLSVKKGRRK